MGSYNLTIIRPDNYLHSSGLMEVRESVGWALGELGFAANSSENHLVCDSGITNIIFCVEHLDEKQEYPQNSIVYNLEQPAHHSTKKVLEIARKNKLKIWDWDASNVRKFQEWGLDARHVPVGYTPNLTRIPDQTGSREAFDILFYGYLTPRRKEILRRFGSTGLIVYATNGLYGGGRDSLISRARIVLNIHHAELNRFEIVRVSYLMANSKCVVSEVSKDDDEYKELHPGFARVAYDDIVSKCQELLGQWDTTLCPIRFSALSCIRKRNMVSYVRNALMEQAVAV